ncbi:MAG: hypothetical protein RLZZ142_207 [Verrucomicrobiota bacterium]
MHFFIQEAVRLEMSNYLQNRTLDGDLIEALDSAHRASDLFRMTVMDLLRQLPSSQPKSHALQTRFFRDLKNRHFRNILTNASPEGYYRFQWLTQTVRAPIAPPIPSPMAGCTGCALHGGTTQNA